MSRTIQTTTTKITAAFIIAGLLALAIATLSFWISKTAQAATQPGYNGRIVFTSNRSGNGEVYIADKDGSNQINLTNSAGHDLSPRVSPDGTKIVFESNRSGNYDIYDMDIDGSSVTNLSNTNAQDRRPTWSPDGSKISFSSTRDGNAETYVMNADGSNPINITNSSVSEYGYVSWSPDSQKIAFFSNKDGDWEIYTANADGSEQVNISNNPAVDAAPKWSPDGTKIAFQSDRSGTNEVYLMDSDGSNQVRIENTSLPSYTYYSTFIKSPTEDLLAIAEGNGTVAHKIFLYTLDGALYKVIDLAGTEFFYAYWMETASPDGSKLLLVGTDELWMNISLYSVEILSEEVSLLIDSVDSADPASWLSIPNTPPVTVDDAATVPFNTPKLIDVLANDTDEEPLSGSNLTIASQPSHGTASVVDGKVRYAPTLGYQGSDSLVYQICDSFLLDQKCSTGTVNVTVSAPVAPAVAVTRVNGQGHTGSTSRHVTSNLRPTFSGTATPGSEIRVEIHSDPIVLTTMADGDGNWSVTPGFDLPTGEHMVYVSATLSGLTTELGAFGLQVGTLASTGVSLLPGVYSGIGLVVCGVLLLVLKTRELDAYKRQAA